jgi:hypothetical protein
MNYPKSEHLPKTLWDWLGLLAVLAIPVVVGFGAAWFTAQQGKVSAEQNTDNQHETALQAYIDKMSELLLESDETLYVEMEAYRWISRHSSPLYKLYQPSGFSPSVQSRCTTLCKVKADRRDKGSKSVPSLPLM